MSKLGKVYVADIYERREHDNPNYTPVLLKQEEKTEGNGLSELLSPDGNSGFTKQRATFMRIHNNQMENLSIQVGSKLEDLLGKNYTIVQEEITASDFEAMDEDQRVGFSPKINPTTEKEIKTLQGGETIYWRSTLAALGKEEEKDSRDIKLRAAPQPSPSYQESSESTEESVGTDEQINS